MAAVDRRLVEVGRGVFAYTQLPGSWGFSNAGLVTDGGESLLVDTLFDLESTEAMLSAMRRATAAAERIGTVVNTHGNGDHCYGNALLSEAEIVGTRGCVDDLRETPPRRLALLLASGRLLLGLGGLGSALARGLRAAGSPHLERLRDAASLALPTFAPFHFPWTGAVLPTRVFEGVYEARVGGKRVSVVEVGPAHTRGDAFVYLPDDRVVFTGDLLFKDAHPVVWQGPVSNWIAACRRILSLDVETVVPGHGPITDKTAIEDTIAYFELLGEETRSRYEAGLTLEEAVRDLAFERYRDWRDAERVYVNVATLYRELAGEPRAPSALELFAGMARLKRGRP